MDATLYESGNGGDVIPQGKDLETTDGLYNVIYILLFGGNTEPENLAEDQDGQRERFDYWANDLFFLDQPQLQYRSITEITLNRTTLSSQGRAEILDAMRRDLRPITQFAVIENLEVLIEGINRCRLLIEISEPSSTEVQQFQFIWDGARLEQISEGTI